MKKAFVLDTNTVIYALNEGLNIQPSCHHLSVITEMELLSFSALTADDEKQLKEVLKLFYIHNIDLTIKHHAIAIRKNYRLKLPDSIILATAIVKDLPLVTSDKKLLNVAGSRGIELENVSL